MSKQIPVIVLFVVLLLSGYTTVFAQEGNQADRDKLAVVQKSIRQDYLMLIERIRNTAREIQDPTGKDKDSYETLKYVIKLIDELQVDADMTELEGLVKANALNRALTKSRIISDKIAKILRIFDEGMPYTEDPAIPSLKEQIQQLQNFLNDLNSLNKETKDLENKNLSELELKEKTNQLAEKQSNLNKKFEGIKPNITDPKAKDLMNKAENELKNAEQQLGLTKPKDADKLQQDAAKDIQNAKDKLQDQLEKYQDKQNEKLLVHVEQEIRKLRDAQILINKQTADCNQKASSEGTTKLRREILKLRSDQKAQKDIIVYLVKKLEEGNVPIFAKILFNIGSDVDKVVAELGRLNLDEYVIDTQVDILNKFNDLLDALHKEQKRREDEKAQPPQQTNDQGKKEPRLVPLPAELEMLLKQQEYLRLKHLAFRDKYPHIKSKADMTPALRKMYERLSQEQGMNSQYLADLMKALTNNK